MHRPFPALISCVALASACIPIPTPGGGGGGGGGGGAVGAAAAAVVLASFADSAVSAGCEPLMAGAWRDAALELDDGLSEPVSDSVRRLASEEVGRVMPRIRELCAQSTPRLERLKQIREELAAPPGDSAAAPPLFAPVYFARGDREVRDDSVRLRLRALGSRLAERPLPLTLVVEGFAEAEGEAAGLGVARANAVLAELRRGGLGPGCCAAVGSVAPAADAAFGRRVTFSLSYQEVAP